MHGGPTTLVSSRCTSGRKTGSRLTSQDARRTNDFDVFKVYIWQKDRISSHFTRCTEDQRLWCLQGVHLAERQDLASLHKMHGGPTTLVSSRCTYGKKTGSRLTSQDARRTKDFSVFKVYIWQKDRISPHFTRFTEDQRLWCLQGVHLAERQDLASLHKMHGGPTTVMSSRCTSGRKTGSRLTSVSFRVFIFADPVNWMDVIAGSASTKVCRSSQYS